MFSLEQQKLPKTYSTTYSHRAKYGGFIEGRWGKVNDGEVMNRTEQTENMEQSDFPHLHVA